MAFAELQGKSVCDIADADDLIETFLQCHRFFLTPRIYPLGTFYAYMISKNVFRPEDQDDAESSPVRSIRVGRFLDIVATKGPAGFRAFLEVLEYEYPHLYWHVTNVKPRDPPTGWMPQGPLSASSVRLKQKMADLISDLANHAEEKQDKNKKLQQYVLEVEEDHKKLKKDLEELNSQKADLVEANKKYKAELDELRRTSCNDRDMIERMRQEISVLTSSGNASLQDRSKSLDMSTLLSTKELLKENEIIQTQLAKFRATEIHLLAELNERKEDYNRLVREYSTKDQECEVMRQKLQSCKEEANYFQIKSGDLASEYNELLHSFQRVTEGYDEEPIYRAYYHAPPVPEDNLYMEATKLVNITNNIVAPPPVVPPRTPEIRLHGEFDITKTKQPPPLLPPRKIDVSEQEGGKCVVIIHAPAEAQSSLYDKLLKRPCQTGTCRKRMFTHVDFESSPYSEVELQQKTNNGSVLHYESKSGIMVLTTDTLKEFIQFSSQHILLQMPPYKEFVIRIKNAGIKFVLILVKVEKQPDSQLHRSLISNLYRQSIVNVVVPQTQLSDIDGLSDKVMSAIKRSII